MSTVTALADRLSTWTGLLGACLVVPLALVMGYEVLARFVLDLPTFWAYEFAWMITGAHFALGIAWVTLHRRHVRVDFLYSRLSRRWQAGIDLVINACLVLPCMAWVTGLLIQFAWEAWVRGEVSGESAWNPVVWPVNSAIALGFAVFCVQLAAEVVKDFASVLGRDVEPPPPGGGSS